MRRIRAEALGVWFFCFLVMAGCSATSRHQLLSTLFDGVPSYPPPEEFCRQYVEQVRLAEMKNEEAEQQTEAAGKGSRHQPYEEKKCGDCHDKTKENGLVTSKMELCFQCHRDFIKGSYVHGPAAVGDCMACHEPHMSRFDSLLKAESENMCQVCHREKRLASSLHDRVAERELGCTDCHDPHFGDSSYFVK